MWPKKEKKMRNKQIKDMVFAASLMAMIVLFSLLYFFQVVGFAAFTIAHIPVLIGAVILGPKYGTALGAVFGITSMIIAIFSLGPNAPFTNPLLSVLPRVIFGWAIYYIYMFIDRVVKNRYASVAITFAVSTLFHTLLVLPILYVVANTGFYFTASENPMSDLGGLLAFIITVLGANGVIEIIVAVLAGTPIVLVMDKLIKVEE